MDDARALLISVVGHQLRIQDSIELSDEQILSIVVSFCERSVSPTVMTARLFAEFGTLSAVISAPTSRLRHVEGMTDRLIAFLKFLYVFKLKSIQSGIPDRMQIKSSIDAKDYLTERLRNNQIEELHALFLDNNCHLLSGELLAKGSSNQVAGYPVEIAKRAIQLGASKIILAHNHPSRRTQPSREDIAFTHSVAATCQPLDIVVEDHVIVAGNNYISLRELGLLHLANIDASCFHAADGSGAIAPANYDRSPEQCDAAAA